MRGFGLCVRFRWTGKPAYHAPEQQVHEQHRDANPRAEEAELQVDVRPVGTGRVLSHSFRAGVIRLPRVVHKLEFCVLALVFKEVKVPEDGQSNRVEERRVYGVNVVASGDPYSGFRAWGLEQPRDKTLE